MSRDRKDSPSVSPSESSEAWLESHASELVDCGRMRCRMLSHHCETRESCFHGGRCPKALRGSRPAEDTIKTAVRVPALLGRMEE